MEPTGGERLEETADGAPPAPVPAPVPAPALTGSVSERLRALGRAPRELEDSDTRQLPPLHDDSPLPEVAPRRPLGPAPPLPPVLPRRMTWALLLAMLCAWVALTGRAGEDLHGLFQPASPTRLLDLGGLVPRAFGEPWRLLVATFLHAHPMVLIISAIMLLVFGGEVERRVGGGALLFLAVIVGAGLNAARVAAESTGLYALAGGWPVGLMLGGAALALAVLAPAPGIRRPPQLAVTLALAAALLAAIAHGTGALGAGFQAVAFLSVGAGLVAGVALSLLRGTSQGSGCLLGGVALLTLVAAEAERARLRSDSPAPPWEAPPPPDLGTLTTLRLDDLALQMDIPPSWREATSMSEATCPACHREVSVPAARGDDAPPARCPECGDGQVQPKPRTYVRWDEPSLMGGGRIAILYSWPKGPYDAADTLAARIVAEMERGKWLGDAVVLADQRLEAEGWRSAWMLAVRGKLGDEPRIYRMYLLVGERRAVRLDALWVDRNDPQEDEASGAFFDALARTVRELPR